MMINIGVAAVSPDDACYRSTMRVVSSKMIPDDKNVWSSLSSAIVIVV